jgi:hypothetical protein
MDIEWLPNVIALYEVSQARTVGNFVEKPKPPTEVDSAIPKPLSDIVMRALEIEPENRCASAREMAQQMEIWLGPSEESSTIFLPAAKTGAYWKWASAALAALLLVVVIVGIRFYYPKPKASHPPVTVLVADFTNHTGEPIFDATLEPMFNVALEGASVRAHWLPYRSPEPVGWLQHHQLYSGMGADIVMESITLMFPGRT